MREMSDEWQVLKLVIHRIASHPVQKLRRLCLLISGMVSFVTIGDAGTTCDVSSMSLE